jgi:phosphonate transport system ATP-binding protein
VLTQLKSICREDGITTVVSLHQVDLAREYADRVVALAHGHVVFDGAPDELTDVLLQTIYDQAPDNIRETVVSPPLMSPFFELAIDKE